MVADVNTIVIEKTTLRSGDLLVANLPAAATEQATAELRKTLWRVVKELHDREIRVVGCMLPAGVTIGTATDEQMHEAGWTRFTESSELFQQLDVEIPDEHRGKTRNLIEMGILLIRHLKQENAELRKLANIPQAVREEKYREQ